MEGEGITARLIAGQAFGVRSPLKSPSETLYADVHLARDALLLIEPSYEERALYTIAGEIEVARDMFEPGQLLVLRPGDPISVRATSDARFMLFGGTPMGGRAIYGGTSCPRGLSASSKPRRSGREAASTPCQETKRSSSPCPKHRTDLAGLQAASITPEQLIPVLTNNP